MDRKLDEKLTALRHHLLKMGAIAEKMIAGSMQALIRQDRSLLVGITMDEQEMDRLQIENDESCVELIALHQPTASDLRMLFSIAKMNNDLERLGDHAVDISGIVTRLLQDPPLKPFETIPRMLEIATAMLKDSLHAFVKRDVATARLVLLRDDDLDRLTRSVIEELKGYMARDPATVTRALNLILIALTLERIGDHATNIAEDVIFIVEGRDVRHQPTK
jgi:phosphate transport system protein